MNPPYKCLPANALPDPNFNYLSNANAISKSAPQKKWLNAEIQFVTQTNFFTHPQNAYKQKPSQTRSSNISKIHTLFQHY
jgi:hypothetical protein